MPCLAGPLGNARPGAYSLSSGDSPSCCVVSVVLEEQSLDNEEASNADGYGAEKNEDLDPYGNTVITGVDFLINNVVL